MKPWAYDLIIVGALLGLGFLIAPFRNPARLVLVLYTAGSALFLTGSVISLVTRR